LSIAIRQSFYNHATRGCWEKFFMWCNSQLIFSWETTDSPDKEGTDTGWCDPFWNVYHRTTSLWKTT